MRTEQTQMTGADPADVVAGWLGPAGFVDPAAQTAGWGPAEWARAREAALVHGIAPLLARRLGGSPEWAALDLGLRAYCEGQLALNRRRIGLLLAELGEVLGAAEAAGVAALPLKGACLIADYYPDPATRPMADLDLLVRPEDEPRLAASLAAIGYRLHQAKPRHRSFIRGEWQVVSYDGEHPDNPRCVEVHGRVDERLRHMEYDVTAELWAGASPASYGGVPGLAPSAAGLLQHLLIHTSHNLFFRRLRLVQLYDLALVAPRLAPADWEELAERVCRAGEARLFYAPLALAGRLFGPLVPAAAAERLARSTPARLRRTLAACSFSELSYCNPREAEPAFKLAWYRPGAEWLAVFARVILPSAYELGNRYPQLAGRPALAYLRHMGHVGSWGARLLLRRPRRLPGEGR